VLDDAAYATKTLSSREGNTASLAGYIALVYVSKSLKRTSQKLKLANSLRLSPDVKMDPLCSVSVGGREENACTYLPQ